MVSHEHYGVESHWLLYCLFNSLFRLMLKKTSKFHITGPLRRYPLMTGRFLGPFHKGPIMQKVFPCYDIIMIILQKDCHCPLMERMQQILWQLGFNSLAPGKFEWHFIYVIFKQILVVDNWDISCETVLIWMSLDFTDDQSTLVQVMAWCRQATSHYLSQCWPRSPSPYGITRPQWVKTIQSM